jgi:dihydropyrimidine dehydrogenase (NAD+) subunit PreA
VPEPRVGNSSTNGGYCGAAVKPIALHMCAQLARHPEFNIPISGIGGICNWRDAVEFLLLGSSSVQVCTEVMLKGYRIVEDMIEGLSNYMDDKGFATVGEMVGRAVPAYSEWGDLDLNYEIVAKIDADKCIGCQLCLVACQDGAHQCIHPNPNGSRVPVVDEDECVGCNLCQIVCPVSDCITMAQVPNGFAPATWNDHVENGAKLRHKKGSHG